MLRNLVNRLAGRYAYHDEAVIISCFYNPMNSPYRLKAFKIFYDSIKHLNHRIVECVIGEGKPQLPESEFITVVRTESLLWHKEALLNGMIPNLPGQFKYVFWVDADVLFTNRNWLVEGVERLTWSDIIQPFEYCVHLKKDQVKPDFNLEKAKPNCGTKSRHPQVWRSFCANHEDNYRVFRSLEYDVHGHVGFAWGARRELLEDCPLYDRALIGGADHIIAHAAVGQISHPCIEKAFKEDSKAIKEWSENFYTHCLMGVNYVKGDLYHIWHGDIEKRQYLKRIKDFTPTAKKITKKDKNGLYVSKGDSKYMRSYFANREVAPALINDGFVDSIMIGYMTNSSMMGTMMGGNPVGAIIGDMLNDSENQNQNEAAPEPFQNESAPDGGTNEVQQIEVENQQCEAHAASNENFS
jgi:hypothetical protein